MNEFKDFSRMGALCYCALEHIEEKDMFSDSYSDWLKAMVNKNCNFLTANEIIKKDKVMTDKPNVVIRHDIDFSPSMALKMAVSEKSLAIKSTFYIFTVDKYKMNFPIEHFQDLEKKGWEIGYHTSTENIEKALSDIQNLKRHFNIRTTVPHMGNLTICKGELQNHIRVLSDGHHFLVQDDGYIADNGGRLQLRISSENNGACRWKFITSKDIFRFIGAMKTGSVYHFLFHPCWYNEQLKFIGQKIITRKSITFTDRYQTHDIPLAIDVNHKTSVKKNSCYQEKQAPKKPAIFIGGTGRSGTTILREILGVHSQIAAIPFETKLIHRRVFREFPHALHQCPTASRMEMLNKHKQLWLNEFYQFKVGWTVKQGDDQFRGLHKWLNKNDIQECLPLLDTMANWKNEYDIYTSYGQFINALFNKYSKSKGKEYWLEKTPANSVYAPFWYYCFPNLKLVNIIRDGRDVACSMNKVVWGIKNPKAAVDWWAINIMKAMGVQKHLPENTFLNVKYEELVHEKRKTLRRITDFLGVEWNDSICKVEVLRNSVGRWKRELPDEAKAFAAAKYKNLLKALGYETSKKSYIVANNGNKLTDLNKYLETAHKKLGIREYGIIKETKVPFVRLKNGLVFHGLPISNANGDLPFDFKKSTIDLEQYRKRLKSIFEIVSDIEFRYLRKRGIVQDAYYCLKPGDVVVEVGAYLGYYSIHMAQKIGDEGKIIAVELIPENYKILDLNLKTNFPRTCLAINKGVYSKDGVKTAYKGSAQICSLRKDVVTKYVSEFEPVLVEIETIDQILEACSVDEVDFMTIQINGSEVEALKGMKRYLPKVKNFAIAAPYGKNEKDHVQIVTDILSENDFEVIIEQTMVYAKNKRYSYNAKKNDSHL